MHRIRPTLAPVFDDLMENLRTRYVIKYRSTGAANSAKERTVRIELQDSRDGGALTIVDADGRPVQTRISVEDHYFPGSRSDQGGDGPRASDAAQISAQTPETHSSSP